MYCNNTFNLSRLAFFALFCLLIAMPLNAEGAVFSWKNKTAAKTVDFDRELQVKIEDVNQMDYVYTAEVAWIPGQPTLPKLPVPGLSTSGGAPLAACMVKANDFLRRRAKTFGTDDLNSWYKDLEADPDIIGCPSATSLPLALKPDTTSGELSLDSQVRAALKAQTAGPGWTMEIRIKVEFRPQSVDTLGAVSTAPKALTTAVIDADYSAEKDEIKAHLEERVFRINFNSDPRIKVSFGPFLSGLGTQRFDQIASPAGDGSFVIGLQEDSDIGFGIAAFWTVPLWDWFDDKLSIGPTWGVAYTADRQLSESIAGMLGVGFGFGDKPAQINLGVIAGQETRLAQGFEVGGAIAADAEIPTTTSLEAAWFLAVSFSF